MATELQVLQKGMKENAESISSLTKSFSDFLAKASQTPSAQAAAILQGNPYFNIRKGEDPMSSRGYSFMKMMGVLTGDCDAEQAKHELGIHEKLHTAYVKNLKEGYVYGGKLGLPGMAGGKLLAPLSTAYMHDQYIDHNLRVEMKQMVVAGAAGADPDEAAWIRRKSMGYKTLSWLNENLGGALVEPPQQGELIELLRNKEALVNAGARTVPLPPQGRLKYPRQTMASTTFWVGENTNIPPSDVGTGEISLQAKKLAVLIKAPNELIRFASPAAEALIRDDMTKSLALGLDLAGLEGKGSDFTPRGVTTMPNINRLNSSAPGVNGDAIVGQDIYRMVAIVEECNAEFEGFIMRPKTLYKYYQLRSSAVGQQDNLGVFLFNLIREAGEGTKPMLGGFPVTKSTQVSQSRQKGNASNLTYILGGMLSDILIGMFGAIEFSATTMGDTPFTADQTWVKGIVSADIQVRHEAALVLLDNLDTTILS